MIKIILAYIIIIALSQFVLTIGIMISGFIVSIFYSIIHKKYHTVFITTLFSILAGIFSSCLVFFTGKIVFIYLVGENSYQIIQFGCSTLGILMPLYNDYKKYKQVRNAENNLKNTASEEVISALEVEYDTATFRGSFIGEIIGIFVFAFYLLIILS